MIYFISGHRDVTLDEFEKNYGVVLRELSQDPKNTFVVGDYMGVDYLSQIWLLKECHVDPKRITIYHMFSHARCACPEITQRIGGFKGDIERDSTMTEVSDQDIAFIRDSTKLDSGTAQNLQRRDSNIILQEFFFI